MAIRKKVFPCGHRGRGQYCHRCEAEARERRAEEARTAEARAQRAAYAAAFEDDAVDLRGLPRHVVEAAREKIAQLEAGAPWQELGGKKVGASTLSIPLPAFYRLLCRYDTDVGGERAVVPFAAMSHEDYNNVSFT